MGIGMIMLHMAIAGHTQSLSPFVIATSGGFVQSGSASVSHTIGELTVVETLISSELTLTQGFQQVFELNTAQTNLDRDHQKYTLFPNPSDGSFTIAMQTDILALIEITMYDLLGRPLYSWSAEYGPDHRSNAFSVSNVSTGTYIIQINSTIHNSPLHGPAILQLQIIH